jgi:hypothetical protein
MAAPEIDRILEKLAKDVEAAVHAMYRGEVRQLTARARTDSIVRDAKAALQVAASAPAAGAGMPSPRPSVAAPVVAGGALGWTKDEGEAVMKCINAWLPMGSPRDAAPDSKCIPAARELSPTWVQRESAREAVRRTATP